MIRNKLIAQVFYDIGYIEKYGSGTTKIIELCRENNLPLPEFKEVSNGFLVVFRKDIYTEDYLKKLGLNERQIKAVTYVKEKGRITNKEYQDLNNVSKATATRELKALEEKEILVRVGITGKGTFYILKGSQRDQRAHKQIRKGSK